MKIWELKPISNYKYVESIKSKYKYTIEWIIFLAEYFNHSSQIISFYK